LFVAVAVSFAEELFGKQKAPAHGVGTASDFFRVSRLFCDTLRHNQGRFARADLSLRLLPIDQSSFSYFLRYQCKILDVLWGFPANEINTRQKDASHIRYTLPCGGAFGAAFAAVVPLPLEQEPDLSLLMPQLWNMVDVIAQELQYNDALKMADYIAAAVTLQVRIKGKMNEEDIQRCLAERGDATGLLVLQLQWFAWWKAVVPLMDQPGDGKSILAAYFGEAIEWQQSLSHCLTAAVLLMQWSIVRSCWKNQSRV
jgi:hypothetical protein